MFFNSLYYLIFRIYNRYNAENEPFASTVFSLSFLEASFLFAIIQITQAAHKCETLNKWWGLSTLIVLIAINYVHFNKSGRAKSIVRDKPVLFKNKTISDIFLVVILLVFLASLIIGPLGVKMLLDNCGFFSLNLK